MKLILISLFYYFHMYFVITYAENENNYNKFPLYCLKTIKKFNLNITSDYINLVCERGCADILEW
jgi:hypothetical protein